MNTLHDRAMAAEVQYRQEQARRSWPESRPGRSSRPPLMKKLLAVLRSSRSSPAPELNAAPRAGRHGLLLVARA